jgi:hypothetical protein
MVHFFWQHIIREGDTVVDATCGRGKDSFEMCRRMAKRGLQTKGRFVGFDVQDSALEETRRRLEEGDIDMNRILLLKRGHEDILQVAKEAPEWLTNVRLISFNLGYLPGGDKSLYTRVDTTIKAVDGASQLIAPGGTLSIVQYPHEEGRKESSSLRQWYKSLPPQDWMVINLMTPLEGEDQPSITFVTRRETPAIKSTKHTQPL